MHKKAGKHKVGHYSNDWQTLELVRSPPAVPRLPETEWSGWPGIPCHKRQSDTGLNALTLTDITKNARMALR